MHPRAPHGPIDTILAELYSAISTPDRIRDVRTDLLHVVPRVKEYHRRIYLDAMIEEVFRARHQVVELSRIEDELRRWQNREFGLSN
jgi:hypothetical protein